MIAEAGDLNASELAGLDHGEVRINLDLDPVDDDFPEIGHPLRSALLLNIFAARLSRRRAPSYDGAATRS